MTKGFFLILLMTTFLSGFTDAQKLQKIASTNFDEVHDLAKTQDEHLMIAGFHTDSLQLFDTTLISFGQNDTITSNGKSRDAYLAKVTTDNEISWVRQFGGYAFNQVQGLATNNGNTVLAISFFEWIKIGDKDTLTENVNGNKYAILNLNKEGNVQWATTIKTNHLKLSLNKQNETFITGFNADSIQIDNKWYKDRGNISFISKFNDNGTNEWTYTLDTSHFLLDVETHKNQLYLGGAANEETLSLGGNQIIPSGNTNSRIFFTKMDQNLNSQWSNVAPVGNFWIGDMAIEKGNSHLWVSGRFKDSMIFDNKAFRTPKSDYDKLLLRLNDDGEVVYSHTAGRPGEFDNDLNVDVINGKPHLYTNVENGLTLFGDTIQTSARGEGWAGWLNENNQLAKSLVTQGNAGFSFASFSGITSINDTTFIGGRFNGDVKFGDSSFLARGGGSGFLWSVPNFTGTSGLENFSKRSLNLSLYPNPTAGDLQLILPEKATSAQLTLYSAQGQVLQQTQMSSPQKTWDLSVPSGIYFLQAENEKGSTVKKVVVK